jgi:hypothetical protein
MGRVNMVATGDRRGRDRLARVEGHLRNKASRIAAAGSRRPAAGRPRPAPVSLGLKLLRMLCAIVPGGFSCFRP